MHDSARVQHKYDSKQRYCVRCLGTKAAIVDGFVNILCAGQPIAKSTLSRALRGK